MFSEEEGVSAPHPDPDLQAKPHVLPLLMEVFAGGHVPTPIEQKQIAAHLMGCEACRTAVRVLLVVSREADRRTGEEVAATEELLARFAAGEEEIERVEALSYGRMGAYAEVVVAHGKRQAAKRFPDVAAHLAGCPDCRAAVAATVASLRGE